MSDDIGRRHGVRTLFIACYELGHQPLSLAWPLAVFRQAGLQAEALDLAVEQFDDERVAAADFVAISVPMHTALRLGVQAGRRVRTINADAHICFYGLYAWLNATYLLSVGADSVVAGEAEPVLLGLVQALNSGQPAESVAGVATRNAAGWPNISRVSLPVPLRSGLPGLRNYAQYVFSGETRLAGYVEASRGCLHTCRHCPIVPVYGGRFFVVPMQVVLADIRQQVAAGARHITFGDPDFLNGPGHALRLARALHDEFPGVSFDFTAKVEHLLKHRQLVSELASLGATFVTSAIESLSDTVLARLNKGHTAADVYEVFDVVRAAGMALLPTLVAFTPWTTLSDYVELVDFVSLRGLEQYIAPVQMSIRLLLPPGSPLVALDEAGKWLGRLEPSAFGYSWRHPDPAMDRLHEAVAQRVAVGESAREVPANTHAAVRAMAYAAAGRALQPAPVRFTLPAPPRLTENWFC
jgi:radical SAM superfamily enzyme YgiQ (UPF0313 family)